jgi:hypothetical protein
LKKKIKSNYLDAIAWIDQQLINPTRQIKVECETIHDLNYSLAINRKQILENSGQLSYSAFGRTKKIKDYLEKSK